MAMIDTGYVDILSHATGADTVNPITDAIPFVDVKEVEIDVFIRASTLKSKMRLGVEFSDNPFDFSGATAVAFSGTYLVGVTDKGWNYKAYAAAVGALATPKLFCRFVVLGRNDTGGVSGEGMQVRVVIRLIPFAKRTVSSPRRRVNTKGGSTVAICPLTAPFETAGLIAHRLWRELTSMPVNAQMEVTFAYQESDTPDDPTSWTTATPLGSTYTTNVVVMPTAFVSVTFTKRFARYVAKVVNASGQTEVEGGHAAMRIELRGC